ncbi:MAG: transposase, partial [Microcystis sp. LE19-4.1E]|nr:transposase [Microcystis sp. LE19-4.1E]
IAGSGKRAGATTKMADLGTIKSPVHDHAGELLISKSATVELIEPSSFNGKMRDELLNETLFFTLDQAREAVAAWAEDYNTERPHSSLAYETPAAYAAKFAATGWHATPLRGSACQPVAQPAQPGIQQTETLKAAG